VESWKPSATAAPTAATPMSHQTDTSPCIMPYFRSRRAVCKAWSAPVSERSTLRARRRVRFYSSLITSSRMAAPGDAAPYTRLQSQRDCVLQPTVARNELPWVAEKISTNPNGVVARRTSTGRNLLEIDRPGDPVSFASSCSRTAPMLRLHGTFVAPCDAP
jgi:hypothetical protein